MSATPEVAKPAPATLTRPSFAKPDELPFGLSIAGVTIAVLALGLAVIPPIAANRPLLAPFVEKKAPEPPTEREGGLTLKFNKVSVNIGGKVPKAKPVLNEPLVTDDPIRWFTVSAIGCALVGLVVAAIAQVRERHTLLTAFSFSACVAAITWQYLMAGLVIGIAVAVLLLILRSLADAF